MKLMITERRRYSRASVFFKEHPRSDPKGFRSEGIRACAGHHRKLPTRVSAIG